MQLTITFSAPEGAVLPLQYNHLLQGFIYHSIAPDLADFLHNQGYVMNNRAFRLFVFSRLIGAYEMDAAAETIRFGSEFQLKVSSPLTEFCNSFANTLLSRPEVRLGEATVNVYGVAGDTPLAHGNSLTVQTQSPVTVYSTLTRPDGRDYTCYFQPGEADFEALVTENLRKKCAILRRRAPAEPVTVRALGAAKLNVVRYKGFIIKGYSGRFRLEGPRDLLQMALDCGLGSKNSQGFGYVEFLPQKKRPDEASLDGEAGGPAW